MLYHNHTKLNTTTEQKLQYKYSPKRSRMLRETDFLIMIIPYSPTTHHFIKTKDIAQMKKNTILINTAHDNVVDNATLIAALKTGTIAGTTLDVFENEPKLNPKYLRLHNVILTLPIVTGKQIGRAHV